MKNNQSICDEEIKISVDSNKLNGALTLPPGAGPHPALALLHGADRSGMEVPYYKEHAETLVQSGFAVLRYDGPGWGGPSPEAWEIAKSQIRAVMDINPADYLTKVHCPVLAIFGEADTSVPVDKSVALYKQYLGEAGNKTVTIEVFPKANHTIHVGKEFAPDYFELMINWLKNLPL